MSSARFQVLDQPVALPGKCAVCGYTGGSSKDDRKFIDFGFDLDFYGVVYFCSKCLTSSINSVGWISPEQAEELSKAVTELETKIQLLMSENANLRAGLNSLSFLAPSVSNSSDEPKLSEAVDAKGPNNSKPARSSNKRGPENVSDNVEDNVLGI
jgi:hypothetical protein